MVVVGHMYEDEREETVGCPSTSSVVPETSSSASSVASTLVQETEWVDPSQSEDEERETVNTNYDAC